MVKLTGPPTPTTADCDVPHRLDPGQCGIDMTHWLWAPEAIEALPWADKLPDANASPDSDEE